MKKIYKKKSLPEQEVKYCLEFPDTPKVMYRPKSKKCYELVVATKAVSKNANN